MILTRSISLVTVSLLCIVAMPASGAMGATKKKSKTPPRPTVSSVAPLTAGVGDQLTIKGNNFVAGKLRNTVFFKAGSKPAVSVKATQATKTMLKVVIPKSVEKYMTVKAGAAQPTRFRLRVLAKRFAKGYVAPGKSPMIAPANAPHDPAVPGAKAPGTTAPGATAPGATAPGALVLAPPTVADCDADGIPDSADGDDDNDKLTDALELAIKTQPCAKDSDGDGNEDAFEYHSALDLNTPTGSPPLPYPGKRPYPNPLDPDLPLA